MQRFTIVGTALSGAGALFLLLVALFYPIEPQFVNNNTASSYVAVAESTALSVSAKDFGIVNAMPIPNYQANLGSSYEDASAKALADANLRAEIQNNTSYGEVAGVYTNEPYQVAAAEDNEDSSVILNPLPVYDYRANTDSAHGNSIQTQVVAENTDKEYSNSTETQVLPNTGVGSTLSSLASFMLLVSLILLKAPDQKFAVSFAFKL